MSESSAKVEVSDAVDGVVHVTLCRPEKRNAVREVEHDRLATVWREFDDRPEVKAVVVSGEGDHFSAGGDLDLLVGVTSDQEVRANAWWAARGIVRGILDCRKPIISAVEGVAVGAGAAVALVSDICVAAENARLLDGHLPYGVSPGDHAAFLWPLAIGINRARGRLLLGGSLTGAEAAEIGLVYAAVPAGTALERADALAAQLARLDPMAVAATKVSLNGVLRQNWQTFEAALALEFVCFANPSTANVVNEVVAQREAKRAAADHPAGKL